MGYPRNMFEAREEYPGKKVKSICKTKTVRKKETAIKRKQILKATNTNY